MNAPESFSRAPWVHVQTAKADFAPKPEGHDYDADGDPVPESYDADDSRAPSGIRLPDDNLAASISQEHLFEHYPVLDLDFPTALIPSTTPGHFHLYLGRRLTWDNYVKLLTVLGEVGILEEGYVAASLRRGYTAVRLPWISKEAPSA